MSKLIIEMEMPKRCAECDIVQKTKSGYRCPIASKMHGFSCSAGRGQLERPYYCPIVGILPEEHGDLIDRDALRKDGMKYRDGIDEGGLIYVPLHDVMKSISNASVIIAAERKDDGN